MDESSYHLSLRQRISQVFLHVLGWAQTRDQTRQSDRQQADGFVRSPDDPDARQRFAAQQREQFERHARQQWRGW
jgi:hypothetical protein